MSPIQPLKLAALDEEDLKVLAAHVQDAVVKVADIKWSATTGAFLLPMNRFAWEMSAAAIRRANNQRRRAVLHFDKVKRVQASGVSADDKDAVLSILTVVFEPGPEPPAGTISIICAGETTLRLEVEYIEARLSDLGAAWAASMRPEHRLGKV